MKTRFYTALGAAFALLLVCGLSPAAHAQQVATPEARSFAIRADDGTHFTIGVAEPLPDGGPHVRIGFLVRCERASGRLEAYLSFGAVPAGKRVQAAAGHPEGKVERFGPVVRGGGPAAGFHSPLIAGRADALRFVEAAFVPGALVSNGHNSVWNRIGERENREVRTALRRCAGAGK
ncbi:MAG: hypothetical protein OXH14_19775 [Alphaproteobacteria bacterium]|nr:hypothetical protein [Alphaproteobacteria bacterium]